MVSLLRRKPKFGSAEELSGDLFGGGQFAPPMTVFFERFFQLAAHQCDHGQFVQGFGWSLLDFGMVELKVRKYLLMEKISNSTKVLNFQEYFKDSPLVC